MKKVALPLFAFAALGSLVLTLLLSTMPSRAADETTRERADKLREDGNWAEAYDLYRDLLTGDDRIGRADERAHDLRHAFTCLQQLGRWGDFDELFESAVTADDGNWRLLQAAAEGYQSANHQGWVSGEDEFTRDQRDQSGRYVWVADRDQVRALQLLDQALPLALAEVERAGDEGDDAARTRTEVANFLRWFASVVRQPSYQQSWKLQSLTDLGELPPFDESGGHHGWYGGRGYGGWGYSQRGIPVDEDGEPIFHQLPESWQAASSDGERWRWLLEQRAEVRPELEGEVTMEWAEFLATEFGVERLAYYPGFGQWLQRMRSEAAEADAAEAGAEPSRFEMHTLEDNETLAWLAPGPKRIVLPDEFDFLRLFRQVSDGDYGDQLKSNAADRLARVFENRRQFDKAAAVRRQSLERWPEDHPNKRHTKSLAQIVDNWGRFDSGAMQPAGTPARVGFVFRNAELVSFVAQPVKLDRLLTDVRAYLEDEPERIEHLKVDLNDIGRRLVERERQRYLEDERIEWQLDLEPAPGHWDRRIDVETPMTEAGAYLLTARLPGGHVSKTLVWLADTVAVSKKVDHAELFFVTDAVTGEPIEDAEVELFGYTQEQIGNSSRYKLITRTWTGTTDADGLLRSTPKFWGRLGRHNGLQALVTVRTDDGRFAFDGWRYLGQWFYEADYQETQPEQTKCFVATDRPVYRPAQEVKFKAWTREVAYDMPADRSEYANKTFRYQVWDPKNEKILDETVEADEFGGIDGLLTLDEDATLGVYRVMIGWPKDEPMGAIGSATFRVEEYKKPEFEVTIEAPEEPVALGELVTATVKANYYFGAPVARGTVKYTVKRSKHDARWFPERPWDWLYGEGYWWYAYDYEWYPGWHRWGCWAPHWPWYNWNPDPPEVVVEGEAELNAEGEVTIDIDTAAAAELHGDSDHRYEIEVTVTDESRRNIDGKGEVLVARDPFKVFTWLDRGYSRVGDTLEASFRAQTLDGKGVAGEGVLRLLRTTWREKDGVSEEEVAAWDLDPDENGDASHRLTADAAGQYRLSYTVTDAVGRSMEGGYVFVVRGEGFDDGEKFRFNDLELITDKAEYLPGESVRLMINTKRANSTVALFVRPANGVYPEPTILRIEGKSTVVDIEVASFDQPNFFIEAMTISDGEVHTVTREVVVPPQKRVMDVTVTPSSEDYRPGEMATLKVRLTDLEGRPFHGSTVVSVYDKALEYISGGGNVTAIRDFFWNWKRYHHPDGWQLGQHRRFVSLVPPGGTPMAIIGVFGASLADDAAAMLGRDSGKAMLQAGFGGGGGPVDAFAAPPAPAAMPMAEAVSGGMTMDAVGSARENRMATKASAEAGDRGTAGEMAEPALRTDFADSALWVAAVATDHDGIAEIRLTMPENLTAWKVKTWAMGHGTVVGEGETEVITSKNLIIRQQAPRFFVETDEVVLSANVHNYLESEKEVTVSLELDGESENLVLLRPQEATRRIRLEAGGEQRVDWRVKVLREGEVAVRMTALTDEESDAVEISYPVFVHGMLKTEAFSGVLRPEENVAVLDVTVPAERRPEQSLLQIRYSPTIAGAMVDALPYLADFPYGCTEQTLNRFVPTVITQQILTEMGIDLRALRQEHANLNPQELGPADERRAQWQRFSRNPVFREGQVDRMVRVGVRRLQSMQLSDGGWGWFSGTGERSSAHTTATVVRGLLVAKANGARVDDQSLQRGVDWLANYESGELQKIKNGKRDKPKKPWKSAADATDALVAAVLAEAERFNQEMLDEIFDARQQLPVSAKALAGLAFHRQGDKGVERRDALLRNIEQFLAVDDENQTAYLNLPNAGGWWYWYGDEIETHAHYLKLLVLAQPDSEVAPGLVKYLLNNRKHGSYWKSTRDTALCIEAIADYFRSSGEDQPDMTLEVVVDGEVAKTVEIDAENLFTYDDRVTLEGDALSDGEHRIEFRRQGSGAVYFNAYLTNFTLEDFIEKAGLEVKIERRYYKLTPVDRDAEVAGQRGQLIDQKVEAWRRDEITTGDAVASGDLIEVELVIESKNDYEYLIIEDLKPAGFEPVDVRSGYDWAGWGYAGLHAYREMRDEKVAFFVQRLSRGKHTLSYRTRAEVPGSFSALPATVSGMYAPELVGNSDELKVTVDE